MGLVDRQYELLEKELELIDSAIRQLDDMTKGIKNWTIVTWTAAVGIALATEELRPFTWFTAAIPTMFWLVDASYRRVQRSFILRNRQISDFVNSEEFKNAIREGTPFSFRLLSLRVKTDWDWKELERLETREGDEPTSGRDAFQNRGYTLPGSCSSQRSCLDRR